jgi:hypothetical protein
MVVFAELFLVKGEIAEHFFQRGIFRFWLLPVK